MEMPFATNYRARVTDFAPMPAHSLHRSERERLDSVTQLISTITLVAQSIASGYRRDTVEGDRLVECVVELSRRALAEVRAWPARCPGQDTGLDPAAVISHALSRAMGPAAFGFAAAPAPVHSDIGGSCSPEAGEERKLIKSLTMRECDMLRLIVSGMSNKEIAAQLHLTEGTVKGYVSHMLSKLNVSDRTQAALFAVRCGVEAAR